MGNLDAFEIIDVFYQPGDLDTTVAATSGRIAFPE
jgi:hypothetical protein